MFAGLLAAAILDRAREAGGIRAQDLVGVADATESLGVVLRRVHADARRVRASDLERVLDPRGEAEDLPRILEDLGPGGPSSAPFASVASSPSSA